MPLKPAKSKKVIGGNLTDLIDAARLKRKQAVDSAFNKAGKSRKLKPLTGLLSARA